MRTVPLNLVVGFVLSGCASQPAASRAAPQPAPPPLATTPAAAPAEALPPAPAAASIADGFRDRVRPILQRRCTPCHEPGGIMYGRLPFDQAGTIRGHREGVLRRLKDDERATVAAWLDEPAS